MENFIFLFAAYSVTWVVLFIYIFSLWRKQNQIEHEIQRLRHKMGTEGT